MSAGRSYFGFSTAASGLISGEGRFCLVSGVGGAAMRGALLSIAAGGSMGLGSILRLSGFSFGALGVTSFSVVVGGTEALGTTLSRCLFLPLSRAGGGIVADGTEAAGVANGGRVSFRLFLLFSGFVAGVSAGVSDPAALGAGETVSFRFVFPLSLAGEAEALGAGGGVAVAGEVARGAVTGVAVAAGLALVAGVALAFVAAGELAAGLVSAFCEPATVGGGTDFGSSFCIFSFNSACAFGSPTGSQPCSTDVCASFSFTTLGATGFGGFWNCCGAAMTSLSPCTFIRDFDLAAVTGSTFVSRSRVSRWMGGWSSGSGYCNRAHNCKLGSYCK